MYQQADRKCAVVQARKHVPLHQRLVFISAGLIGRVLKDRADEQRAHKRHSAMWQTWIVQAARSLTQTVSACGKAARLPGERRKSDSAA